MTDGKEKVLKRTAVLVIAACVLLIAYLIGSREIRAKERPDTGAVIHMNSLLTDAVYEKQITAGNLPGLEGGALVFTDEKYRYYTNGNGQLLRIDDIRGKDAVYPEQAQPGYTKEDAKRDAVDLTCRAYILTEGERDPLSLERHSAREDWMAEAEDFNGSFYLVTLTMVKGGVVTGNKAVVDLAADGTLISALFIRETWSEKGERIPEEKAKELAEQYFPQALAHDLPTLADKLVSTEMEGASTVELRGDIFWDVTIHAVYDIPELQVGDALTDDHCKIRINAETGEYVFFETRFK